MKVSPLRVGVSFGLWLLLMTGIIVFYLWQWLHTATPLSDGRTVTRELVEKLIDEEYAALAGDDASPGLSDARDLFTEMALSDHYEDFLTIPAYERMP